MLSNLIQLNKVPRSIPEGDVRNSLVKQHNSIKQKSLEAPPKGNVRNVLVKELKVPRSIPEGDVRYSLVKQHNSVKQKFLEAPPKGNVRNSQLLNKRKKQRKLC